MYVKRYHRDIVYVYLLKVWKHEQEGNTLTIG